LHIITIIFHHGLSTSVTAVLIGRHQGCIIQAVVQTPKNIMVLSPKKQDR